MLRVVLGPSVELHVGIHGALVRDPPPAVQYLTNAKHQHTYFSLERRQNFDPFRHFAVLEEINYPRTKSQRPIGIHSSRLPVSSSLPWIVDADCLLATLIIGNTFALGQAVDPTLTAPTEEARQLRAKMMIEKYISSSCKAILLRSEFAKQNLIEFIKSRAILPEDQLEKLGYKTHVLRPTLPAVAPIGGNSSVTRIIYMGRSYEDKGGPIAFEVFKQLHSLCGVNVETVWIGPAPKFVREARFIRFNEKVDATTYFRLLSHGHVFFSPSEYESYGMALVEAACLSLGIVTACGKGMEHICEIFTPGKDAYLVDNGLSVREKIAEYLAVLSHLVMNRHSLRELRLNAFKLASNGVLSKPLMDLQLKRYYEYFLDHRVAKKHDHPDLHRYKRSNIDIARLYGKHIGKSGLRILVS